MFTPGNERPAGIGVYFAILASALVSLVLVLFLAERLGADVARVRAIVFGLPIFLFVLIGALSSTNDRMAFYVSGRRVPAFYNGLTLSISALGGIGLFTLTGIFLFLGYDALPIALGFSLGILLMAVLIAPYYRKFGAYTLPSYLGHRFNNPVLRLVSAIAFAVPLLLFVVAELRLGVPIVAHALGWGLETTGWLAVLVVAALVVGGGMVGQGWTGAAQALLVLIGILVPLSIAAVIQTNIPLPQLSFGIVMSDLAVREAALGIQMLPDAASGISTMPGMAPAPIARPFLAMFASLSPAEAVLLITVVTLGTSSLPALVSRAATPPSVYETRKSFAWMAFIVAMLLLCLPAAAVFIRDAVLRDVVGAELTAMPRWVDSLISLQVADIANTGEIVRVEDVRLSRDGALIGLPVMLELPVALQSMMLAALASAVLAAVAARVVTLGQSFAEDIVFAFSPNAAPDPVRIHAARAAMVLAIVLCGWLALNTRSDPLQLLMWGLSLSAATVFPVIVMSIWWKRLNVVGALAGIVTGFIVTALHILAAELIGAGALLGVSSYLSAAYGVPAAAIVALTASLATGDPGPEEIEMVREMRVPGGEALFDRRVRLAALSRTAPED